MLKKIILGGFVAISLFAFTNCKKEKKETPAPIILQTETSAPNEFVADGQGYSKQLFVIDTTVGYYPRASASRYTGSGVNDSLLMTVSGTAMINGTPQTLATRIAAIYSGLRTYDLANSNDHCSVSIEFYNGNSFVNYKVYRSISGSLTFTKADIGGRLEGTYSGTFELYGDPSKTITITDGKFSSHLGDTAN